MEVKTSGDTLVTVFPKMIEQANRVKIITIGGNEFIAYPPISIAHDHITFATSVREDETVAIRWDAIATISAARAIGKAKG